MTTVNKTPKKTTEHQWMYFIQINIRLRVHRKLMVDQEWSISFYNLKKKTYGSNKKIYIVGKPHYSNEGHTEQVSYSNWIHATPQKAFKTVEGRTERNITPHLPRN